MFQRLISGMFHTPWNILRVFQTLLASMVLIQAITDAHYLLIIPALFILYMGLSGSCMSCNTSVPGKSNNTIQDIPDEMDFTEIKNN